MLTESAAIIWYLSETYGQDHNRLVPTEPKDRARCLEWCFFVLGELDETSLYVMRRHSDMRQTYGEAPVAVEAATTYFRKQMRTVERALETNPSYILGERFTAATFCSRLALPGRCTMVSSWRTRFSHTMHVQLRGPPTPRQSGPTGRCSVASSREQLDPLSDARFFYRSRDAI